jgi:phosphoenolpyruvate carboxykinase (GTP)
MRGDDGKFLWPGFGENLRVLRWMIERCKGWGKAVETPIGLIPAPGAIEVDDLPLAPGAMQKLLSIDRDGWLAALNTQDEFFGSLGRHLPHELQAEHAGLAQRLRGGPVRSGAR